MGVLFRALHIVCAFKLLAQSHLIIRRHVPLPDLGRSRIFNVRQSPTHRGRRIVRAWASSCAYECVRCLIRFRIGGNKKLNMKNWILVSTLAFCGLATGVFLSRLLYSQATPNLPPPRQPFTFEWVEKGNAVKSGRTLGRRLYRAVRADHSTSSGPVVKEVDSLEAIMQRRITLVPKLTTVTVHDASRTTSTEYFAPPPQHATFKKRDNPSDDCASRVKSGLFVAATNILNVRAIQYRSQSQIVNDEIKTDDLWVAPTLGCEPIQIKTEWRGTDGVLRDTFEKIPVRITLGEPDSSLFRVPAEYKEVPPSEQEELVSRGTLGSIRGEAAERAYKPTKEQLEQWKRLDQRYFESRKLRPQ